MNSKNFILLFLMSTLLSTFNCKSIEKSDDKFANKTDGINEDIFKKVNYSSIEIYCWCFYDSAAIQNKDGTLSKTTSDCTTPFPITPLELINQKDFFDSVSSVSKIEAFRNLVFERKKNVEPRNLVVDSRFLILFKKNNFEADTLVLYSSSLLYNGKYLLNYSFNIFDSIRNILGINKIDCNSGF